jgi:hypothetical protein
VELRRYWSTAACLARVIKRQCTTSKERRITRWAYEHLVEDVPRRLDANPDLMRVRRERVEHPFGTIKARMGATHSIIVRSDPKTFWHGQVIGNVCTQTLKACRKLPIGRYRLARLGDGGLQFTIPELACAAELRRQFTLLVYDNRAYGMIKDGMVRANIKPLDPSVPRLDLLARAYGAAYARSKVRANSTTPSPAQSNDPNLLWST